MSYNGKLGKQTETKTEVASLQEEGVAKDKAKNDTKKGEDSAADPTPDDNGPRNMTGDNRSGHAGDDVKFSNNPVDDFTIISPYGVRDDVNVDFLGVFHSGIDFPVPNGTEVKATGRGKVTQKGYNSFYGNYIAIEHENGFTSFYIHLSKILVSINSTVIGGNTIALSGNSGESAEGRFHLHYSLFPTAKAPNLKNNAKWASSDAVDPENYLPGK
jgi:murein DD-endopeptidase MepM/ murein hydrolase activator NlpD